MVKYDEYRAEVAEHERTQDTTARLAFVQKVSKFLWAEVPRVLAAVNSSVRRESP